MTAAAAAPANLRTRATSWLGTRLANPLIGIELAASFRRRRFLVTFTLSLLVVVAILIIVVAANLTARPAHLGQWIFSSFLPTIAVVVLLLFPAFSCTSLVEEKLNKSLDLLLVTRLEPWEIFVGKALSAFIYCAVFLAGTLPVVGLSFLFGGIEPSAIVAVYVGAILLGVVISVIGTFASAITGTVVRAIVASYVLSWITSILLAAACSLIYVLWVGPSLGVLSSSSFDSIQSTFATYGDLIYVGAGGFYAVIVAFFTIVGANRLKPPAYERTSALRVLAAVAIAGGVLLYSAALRRIVDVTMAAPSPPSRLDLLARMGDPWLVGTIVAAVLLFLPVLVFPTERAELSRRIQLDLEKRSRLSPLRLLLPGPARGFWFAVCLVTLVLFGSSAFALHGLGLGEPDVLKRGDLAPRDLVLVLASFLTFLAAAGRLLAEYSRGAAAPRLAVAGLAVVLLLGPILLMLVDVTGVSGSEPTQPRPSPFARCFVLSPILAGATALDREVDPARRARSYLFPETLAEAEAREGVSGAGDDKTVPVKPRVPYSETPLAEAERRAVPLHSVSSVLYLVLAAVCWSAAARRARQKRRAAGAAKGAEPKPPAVPGAAPKAPAEPVLESPSP